MFINKTADGRNNICGSNVAALRKRMKISQRELADRLQLIGLDLDKNAILVKGSVPGAKGAILKLKTSVKA